MNKIQQVSITIIFMMITFDCFSWTMEFSFDKGIPGERISEFSDSSGTLYDNSISYEGENSIQMNVKEGTAGFGNWGGVKDLPSPLTDGDTLWTRISMFVPTDFDFTTNTGYLKFLRYKVSSAENTHRGYQEILIAQNGTFRFVSELGNTVILRMASSSSSFQSGDGIVGLTSGETGTLHEQYASDRLSVNYTKGGPNYMDGETIKNTRTGATAVVSRVASNKVTDFGSSSPIQKGVWENLLFGVKFGSSDAKVVVYKEAGGSMGPDGKRLGGTYELIFTKTSELTLTEPTDLVKSVDSWGRIKLML